MTPSQAYPVALPGPSMVSAPSRRPGSVRRTSHVDVTRVPLGAMISRTSTAPTAATVRIVGVKAGARDLITRDDGEDVAGDAALALALDETGAIATLAQAPAVPSCTGLLGLRIGFGFRSAAKALLAATSGSPLGALVDDLSGAFAPTGYAAIRDGIFSGLDITIPPPAADAQRPSQLDVCAGWREHGMPMQRRLAGLPILFDKEPFRAPSLASDDPLAWHELPPLGHDQTRRLRRTDVVAERDHIAVDAMFRDISVDPDLTQRVVHEYAVVATIDPATMTIVDIVADPRALPFPTDCPVAAGSAGYLVGHQVNDLRRTVRQLSAGPTTCTHLNDLFRSLGDLPYLLTLI
jgi:hypothetical protein